MSESPSPRHLDLTRHVVPAGVLVSAIIGALIAWFQLETKIDRRIDEKIAPIQAELVRIEKNQGQNMREIRTTLDEMRRDLAQVRESLARMEGEQR